MVHTREQVQQLRDFILAIPPGNIGFTRDGSLTATGTAKRTLLWLIDKSENLTKPFHVTVAPFRYRSGEDSTPEQYYYAEATNLAWCLGAMSIKADTPLKRIFGKDEPTIWGTELLSRLIDSHEPEDEWTIGFVTGPDDKVEPQFFDLDEIDRIELPAEHYKKLDELVSPLPPVHQTRPRVQEAQKEATLPAPPPRPAVRVDLPPPKFTKEEIAELKRLIINIPAGPRTRIAEDGRLVANDLSKKTLLWIINGSQDLTHAFETSVPAYKRARDGRPTWEQWALGNAITLSFLLHHVEGAPRRTLDKLLAHLDTRDGTREDVWHLGFFTHMQDDIVNQPLNLAAIDATKLEL